MATSGRFPLKNATGQSDANMAGFKVKAVRGIELNSTGIADIGQVKTVYLSVRTDGVAGSGTHIDPFDCGGATDLIKAGKYDALINGFRTAGGNYHVILAEGTFCTFGGNGNTNAGGAIYPQSIRVTGQGQNNTTLKLAAYPNGINTITAWDAGGGTWGVICNLVTATAPGWVILEDLTIDANWQNLGSPWINKAVHCVQLFGSNNTVRTVTFKNMHGDLASNYECFSALFWATSGATTIITSGNTAENCRFETPRGSYHCAVAFVGGTNATLKTDSRGISNVAIGRYRTVTDGETINTSANLKSVTAAWTTADKGTRVMAAGVPEGTTIIAYVDAQNVTMSANATGSATGVTVTTGSGFDTGLYNLAYVDGVQITGANYIEDGPLCYHDTGTAKNVAIKGGYCNRSYVNGIGSHTFGATDGSWMIDNWTVDGTLIRVINNTGGFQAGIDFESDLVASNCAIRNCTFIKDTTGTAGDYNMVCIAYGNVSGLKAIGNNCGTLPGTFSGGTNTNPFFLANRSLTATVVADLLDTTGGTGSTGDVSSNTSTSVDGEMPLFSGTGGKTIKRSTLTGGILKSTSGVPAIAVARTDYWDTTVMVASGASHAKGLVPDTPGSSGTTKYLREDGTWAIPPAASGVTIASTTLVIKGDNAGGGIAATPGNTTGDYVAPSVALGRLFAATTTVSGATPAIDWNLTTSFKITLSANATFTFSNSTDGWDLSVAVTNTASNWTVTWPTVDWGVSGVQPTQSIGAVTNVWSFKKIGAVIYGAIRL